MAMVGDCARLKVNTISPPDIGVHRVLYVKSSKAKEAHRVSEVERLQALLEAPSVTPINVTMIEK